MYMHKSGLNKVFNYLFLFSLFSSVCFGEDLTITNQEENLLKPLFPYGIDSIYPEAVIQGQTGDCQAISAIASLARTKSGKKLIMSYFSPIDDDIVSVTLPGGVAPILVAISDIKKFHVYGYSPDGGLWLPVLERALARYAVEF